MKQIPCSCPDRNAPAARAMPTPVQHPDLPIAAQLRLEPNVAGDGHRPWPLLHLQRYLGNRYVQRYVQQMRSAGEDAHPLRHDSTESSIGSEGTVASRALQRRAVGGRSRDSAASAKVQRQPASNAPAQAPAHATGQATDQAPAHDSAVGAHAFNLILQNQFTVVNNAWYSGTRSDLPPGGAVQADLTTGRSGRVLFALSPDFAAAGKSAAETATDPARIAAVRTQVMRVLAWRLAQGILTAEDITASFVSEHLRSMDPLALRGLRAKPTVDPAAQAELDRILAITTQLPATAQFNATGAATVTINGLTVRVMPDTRGGTENATSFKFVPPSVQTPGFAHVNGRVTTINGPLPVPPVIEIVTNYAQTTGDPLTATSAYGRGTTAADTAAGSTSLRFHESRHSDEYLRYIASHPFPTYTGSIGMTVAQFTQAGTAFLGAVATWARDMGHVSNCATDCVGSPDIDTFKHNVGARMECII